MRRQNWRERGEGRKGKTQKDDDRQSYIYIRNDWQYMRQKVVDINDNQYHMA